MKTIRSNPSYSGVSFRVARGLAAVVLVSLTSCPARIDELEPRELEHGGLTRTYVVHVPCRYTEGTAVPLVIALHGAGGDGERAAEATEFNLLSEREGFIVAYPDGVANQWNDGRDASFGDVDVTGVDDVGFIAAMVDALTAEYSIDASRVYVMGISNGAAMTQRLACELSERFAAAVSVIGSMAANIAEDCAPSVPVPMLMVNGTEDPLILWDGGYIAGNEAWGELLPVEETAQRWATHNGCAEIPEHVWLPDLRPFDGEEVWRDTYACEEGNEVVLYGIVGGGHSWPDCGTFPRRSLLSVLSRDVCFTEVIWDFFAAHSRG